MAELIYKLGFVPSVPDHRDYIYGAMVGLNNEKVSTLPSEFFNPRIPENLIYTQTIGDCVGESSRYIRILDHYRNYKEWIDLNGDFVYSICKTMDGDPTGEGTQPKFAQQVMNTIGICHRDKYVDLTSNDNRPTPSQDAYNDAKQFTTKSYAKIQTLDEIKHALVEQGAVQGAVIVCDNFMKPEIGGFINLPQGTIVGGHAICIDGYSDTMTHKYADNTTRKGFLRVLNSWGVEFGDGGYIYIPYDFLTFKTDLGMQFFIEAWSSVDTDVQPIPTPQPVNPTPVPQPQPTNKLYHVQVGAYSKSENAQAMVDKLKAAGFDAFIKYE